MFCGCLYGEKSCMYAVEREKCDLELYSLRQRHHCIKRVNRVAEIQWVRHCGIRTPLMPGRCLYGCGQPASVLRHPHRSFCPQNRDHPRHSTRNEKKTKTQDVLGQEHSVMDRAQARSTYAASGGVSGVSARCGQPSDRGRLESRQDNEWITVSFTAAKVLNFSLRPKLKMSG